VWCAPFLVVRFLYHRVSRARHAQQRLQQHDDRQVFSHQSADVVAQTSAFCAVCAAKQQRTARVSNNWLVTTYYPQ
jgi:hypothetical protein